MGKYSDKILYVVSGHQRCGTSMMMDCITTGSWGLEAEYDLGRKEFTEKYADDDYHPNENGLYELSREQYMKPDFPYGYEGSLIKALNEGVRFENVLYDGVKCIYMRRPYDQIRRSWRAFFGKQLPHTSNETEHRMWQESIIEMIQNRKDFLSVDVLWYPEVVEDPLTHFERLRNRGWPIHARKAASVVDADLFRHTHKREPEVEKEAA